MFINRNQPNLGFGQPKRWVIEVPYPSGTKTVGPFTAAVQAAGFAARHFGAGGWQVVALYPQEVQS